MGSVLGKICNSLALMEVYGLSSLICLNFAVVEHKLFLNPIIYIASVEYTV